MSADTPKKEIIAVICFSALALMIFYGRPPALTSASAAALAPWQPQKTLIQAKVVSAPAGQRIVRLSFDRKGTVSKVYVHEGDRVTPGQKLAELDAAGLIAQMHQAAAGVKIEQAKLLDLKNGDKIGTRDAASRMESVRATLDGARKNLAIVLQDAYAKSDDAVRAKTDQFFVMAKGTNPSMVYSLSDAGPQADLLSARWLVERELNAWKSSLDSFGLSSGNALSYVSVTETYLRQIKGFLDMTGSVLNNIRANDTLTITNLHNWRIDVFTGRTNLTTALRDIAAAEARVKEAQAGVTLQENDLTARQSGASDAQIMFQEGKVEEAQAKSEAFQSEVDKMALMSPVRGIVIRQNAHVGMVISGVGALITIQPAP